jgi:hypothetical protein
MVIYLSLLVIIHGIIVFFFLILSHFQILFIPGIYCHLQYLDYKSAKGLQETGRFADTGPCCLDSSS